MYASIKNEERLKAMLKDLGRSTLRGIRKCYKCGTLNGTRGLSCKNKACDVVFTEAGRKKKQSMEVCKLHTGTSPQVFSVRVREKGPDFRGFVQLPVVQSNLEECDTSYFPPVTAVCFVESCQRLFNNNILKCHERALGQSVTTCQHIQSAMRCCSDAVILRIDYKVLQSINTTQEMKESIWRLNSESSGSAVQRVSKTIMAVKCAVTSKHTLGFLHITIFSNTKWKDKGTYFTCPCPKNLKTPEKNCIHYYACVAAFASDNKLSTEFSSFVAREKVPESYTLTIDPQDEDECRFVEIFNPMNQCEVEIEVLDKEDETQFMLPEIGSDLDGLTSIVDVASDLDTGLDPNSLCPVITKLQELPTNNKYTGKSSQKPLTIKKKGKSVKKETTPQYYPLSEVILDPKTVYFPFISWLSSVTERINQTMHIQFDGKPEPLVFHIPHSFCDCLLGRFVVASTNGNRTKRLPNSMTTFTRKESAPLGTFSTYTWHITSLTHAKAIFDTPYIKLNSSRNFVQKPDGTFEDVDPATLEEGLSKREGERSIRPMEFKTFLKIGKTSPDQETPSFLTLSWTPNILPISKIGELIISFEYGHSQSVST